VAKEGAISQLQYQRQQQEVLMPAEVERLTGEQQRIPCANLAKQESSCSTISLSAKRCLTKIVTKKRLLK